MCWKISTAQKAFLMEHLDYFKNHCGNGAVFFLCIYETLIFNSLHFLRRFKPAFLV